MPARKRFSTGLELVLNACEGDLQIVLTDDEELVCAQNWAVANNGTEILAPVIRQIFALAGKRLADLKRIGCVRGPGGFTGIRLVLATAAALRRTTGAQLAALDYLRALATTLAMQEQLLYGNRIWVLTHARRGLVHALTDGFVGQNLGLVHACCHMCYGPVIPAAAMRAVELATPEEVLEAVSLQAADGKGRVHVLGSGLVRNVGLRESLEDLASRSGTLSVRADIIRPSVPALRLLGRHGDYFPEDVEPLYVRPCDAIENLPRLAEKMGCSASRSVSELDRMLHEEPHSAI